MSKIIKQAGVDASYASREIAEAVRQLHEDEQEKHPAANLAKTIGLTVLMAIGGLLLMGVRGEL